MSTLLSEQNLFDNIFSSIGSTYEDEQSILKSVSTIMTNTTALLNDKPIHLHFLRGLSTGVYTDEFRQKLKELPVTIIFCDSWEKFTTNFKHRPGSVSFDVDNQTSSDSINEIVGMINTLSKFISGNNNISIAARIDKDTSFYTIKLLQKSNVMGILPKLDDFGEQEVFKALHAQWANIPYWPKHIIDQLPGASKPIVTKSKDIKLTPRQEQIFSIVVTKGVSNKSIAKMLHITESTVKLHMGHILKKFGVKNRTQLVAFNKS